MSNITYIYNMQNEIKLLDSLNYTLGEFESNPTGCYPAWNTETMYATDTKFNYPVLDGDTIREKTQEELKIENIIPLGEGEKIENGKLIIVEKPKGVKIEWNYETFVYEEKATESEITEFVGELVTKLLYEVLNIGCEVIVQEQKHKQSLEKSKREALDEQIGAINLSKELSKPITTIMWPFADDGSDTIIMTVNEFKQMVLDCHKYGQDCYIAAELLKAKRKIDITLDDFYAELKNVNSISIENLV